MTRQMGIRGRKPRPGRITFVGSGPGDPGLLTTRAATVLANAALVFIDPDVPEPVLALIGKDLPPVSGPAQAGPVPGSADDAAGPAEGDHSHAVPAVMPGGPDVRPALGDPAEVAKTLIAEARSGVDVVRLVAGDPLDGRFGDHRGERRRTQSPARRDRARPGRDQRRPDLCGACRWVPRTRLPTCVTRMWIGRLWQRLLGR